MELQNLVSARQTMMGQGIDVKAMDGVIAEKEREL